MFPNLCFSLFRERKRERENMKKKKEQTNTYKFTVNIYKIN